MQSSNPVLNRSSAFAPGHGQAYPGAAPYGHQPGQYGGPGVPPQQYQGAPAGSRPMTLTSSGPATANASATAAAASQARVGVQTVLFMGTSVAASVSQRAGGGTSPV